MSKKIKIENIIEFKKSDAKKQIVFVEVYAPHVRDTDGNFMTAETIEKMAYDFLASKENVQISKNCIVESFIARKDDPDFTQGAWVVGIHVPDKEIWQQIEKGDLTGLSIESKANLIEDVIKMSNEEKKEIFMKLSEQFKGAHIGYLNGKYWDYEKEEKLYNALYEAMDKTDSFDADYLKHVPQTNGSGYYMLYNLIKDKAPLKDCFTALTFLLKNHDKSPGSFSDAVSMQVVYDVLNRICELL